MDASGHAQLVVAGPELDAVRRHLKQRALLLRRRQCEWTGVECSFPACDPLDAVAERPSRYFQSG
jgi:hypothetical protein